MAKAAEFGMTFRHGPMGRHELVMFRLDDGQIVTELRGYGSGTREDPWPLPSPGTPAPMSGWYGSPPPLTATTTVVKFDAEDVEEA